ncbi:PH domain-containing protein [Leifsonia sp. 98AMF]|uniref:PH domain-containing protein n=1 Tax=unclassified Leifsonia TaxID=2663824 RepID=UPI00087A11E7|nr:MULTISPECIES: PH domain-containing protein [unclassified Leifsonia]SDH45788.1 PH domain-containing protein [Leifsonia sp. 197AMF]SDI91656.1 PH domain-containing protein [Leifsonia sp. 466MF]SDJ87912.1 PH domain-containing protein [Leifsonia sp. 157MF]SDN95371.1 PH domain-containing protein [Leifsonia sp. 509MF]SEN10122.1 PH domain-containing protein [Leifsonia sp. 467MF]
MPYVSPAEREVFVSRFNRVLAVLIWAAAAALTMGLLFSVHDARLLYIVPGALFAFVAWAMLWRPQLTVADEGITVVNVTRTVRIPWEALIAVDTKYALTLYTPGRKIPVWAAPAPGTGSTLRATRNETKGRIGRPRVEDSVRRPGDLLGTESGAAAEVVRRRWGMLQDAGAIDAGRADETPVTVRWHLVELAVLVLLLAGTVAALLLA